MNPACSEVDTVSDHVVREQMTYEIVATRQLTPVTKLFEVRAPAVARKTHAGQFVIVVNLASLVDQQQRKVGIDSPVALLIGVGKRAP